MDTESKKRGLFASTMRVSFQMTANIVFSFAAQLLIAFYFGTSAERDAFFTAITIPTYISTVFTGSIAVIFLPMFIATQESGGEEASKLAGNITIFSAFVLSIVAVICIWQSDFLVTVMASGFDQVQLQLSSHLLKYLMPTIIFQSLTGLFAAIHQAEHRFGTSVFAPIITTIVTIIVLISTTSYLGIDSLAIGNLTGSLLSTLFLLYGLVQRKSLLWDFDIRDKKLAHILLTSSPLLITGILFRLTGIIEKMIASNLSQGSVSYLGYANQLATTLSIVVTSGIAMTVFPFMARSWSEQHHEQFYEYILRGIMMVLISCVPLIAIVLVFATPIITIIFERGSFNHVSTLAVASTLKVLMGSFLFSSLGGVIAKAFYVMSRTKVIAAIAITEIAVYIVTGYILVHYISYLGLAAALTLSTGGTIFICMYLLFFKNKENRRKGWRIGRNLAKIIISAVGQAAVCWIVFNVLPDGFGLIVRLFLAVSLGIGAYFSLVIYIMKVDYSDLLRERILNIFNVVIG